MYAYNIKSSCVYVCGLFFNYKFLFLGFPVMS